MKRLIFVVPLEQVEGHTVRTKMTHIGCEYEYSQRRPAAPIDINLKPDKDIYG